jgi:hypothetical protein
MHAEMIYAKAILAVVEEQSDLLHTRCSSEWKLNPSSGKVFVYTEIYEHLDAVRKK